MNMRSDNLLINQNIPGWNSPEILLQLAHYAKLVPENGTILELGALFGRSTYSLGHNKHYSVTLHVIELWPTIFLKNHKIVNFHDDICGQRELQLLQSKYKSDPDRLEGDDHYLLFREFTQDIVNMSCYRGHTNRDNSSYPEFDLIYHDAGHHYDDVWSDLVHWFPKLKHNGIFILDDYERKQYSGLCEAVDKFVAENNLHTEMITPRNILLKRK